MPQFVSGGCPSFLGPIIPVVLLLTLNLSLSPPLHGQLPDTVVIPADPACADCRLELTVRVSLGDEAGDGFVGEFNRVAADRHFYYVVNRDVLDEIRVFDRTGRFVRTMGRQGAGPAEFKMIWDLRVSPADTLQVIDIANLRRSIIAPDGGLARTSRVPGRLLSDGFVPLPDGGCIINVILPDREGKIRLLHHLDSEGRILASFDDAPSGTDPFFNLPATNERKLALTGDGHVLSARGLREIDVWSLDGQKTRVLSLVGRDWLEDAPGGIAGYSPAVTFLRTDREGRLWVLVRVGDPRWREALRTTPGERSSAGRLSTSVEIADYDGYWDSVIEVIDLSVNRVLVRARLPMFLTRIIETGEMVATRLTAEGYPHLDVYEVRLSKDGRSIQGGR